MRDYSFGNFLRELRERRGLSQYQLGMLVGVSNKAVSKWESGSAKPQSRILYHLSDILGVTVDELLACKYRSTETRTEQGVFAMQNNLWKKVRQTLHGHYGEEVPIEILNRYFSEVAEFEKTDMIVYFDLFGRIKARARELGEQMRVPGTVGASFVAYLLGVTEINPLKPHYFCPHCRTVEFSDAARCGWDLPAKRCSCGNAYLRDGQDLPFETLRNSLRPIHFELSVSCAFYGAAKELIGSYFEGNTTVTLTRKDHPNLETVVVLKEELPEFTSGQTLSFEEYYDRLRQHPAITLMANETLDSLRLLEEKTKVSVDTVDFICPGVLEAFQKGDTDGIPEFCSDFVKNVIRQTAPASFYDLIQIAGLAHGTGVWTDNAQRLIEGNKPVREVIAYRDDVFRHIQEKLERKGVSHTGLACKVMEDTRRGLYAKNGVPTAMRQQFSSLEIEDWFADSLEKIQYVFPKAHGVLYVKYGLIFMWYKLNYPADFQTIHT